MADYAAENQKAEAETLKQVEATIEELKATKPVAALIVEPIQAGQFSFCVIAIIC